MTPSREIECEQNKHAYCSEHFVKKINAYSEKTGKAEALGSTSAAQSLYSSRLSHRSGSMKILSHASNQSNDKELLRLKEMVVQLELEVYSEKLSELKNRNAEETARLNQQFGNMTLSIANEQSELASKRFGSQDRSGRHISPERLSVFFDKED